jgi:putative copper export protein
MNARALLCVLVAAVVLGLTGVDASAHVVLERSGAASSIEQPGSSPLELPARSMLILGLVALLGAATAGAAGFGGSKGTDVRLAAGGWLLSVAGVILLAEARRRSGDASMTVTATGGALRWQAVALVGCGAALLLAHRRRSALVAVAAGALATMALHIAAGHAGPATVLGQLAHFAAAGVWIGGLATLLLGVRGTPTAGKAAAVRRFSRVAAGALAVVVITGLLRAVQALPSLSDLGSSGYGQAIVAKVALLVLIVGIAWRNRRRSVPAAAADLGPLRRTSRIELGVAAGALIVAGLLGTLAPPVVDTAAAEPALSKSGADFAKTLQVRLTARSPEPGPNRFTVRISDYQTDEPVPVESVRLRFAALDDPDVASSSLLLLPAADDSFEASGANLAFDGRWNVDVLIERRGETVAVPLELQARGPAQFVSVLRAPGRPAEYTRQVPGQGFLRLSARREQAGPSKLHVTAFTVLETEAHVDQLVLTLTAGRGPARRQTVRRRSAGRYVSDVDLRPGVNTVAVIARTRDGSRMRSTFELDVTARAGAARRAGR